MDAPDPPKPPDPMKTAGAQTAQNIGTATAQQFMGNVNQVTPNGSLTYDQSGTYKWTDPNSGHVYDIPTFTATQTLSPEAQKAKGHTDQAQINLAQLASSQSDRLNQVLSQLFTPSNLPGYGHIPNKPELKGHLGDAGDLTRTYSTDFSKDRKRVEDALLTRLQGQIGKDRDSMAAQLANQGIGLGSEAYSAAQDDFGRSVNDARMAAILGAGQEQSRMVGMEAQRAGFENAAQQQAFNQMLTRTGFLNDAKQQNFNNALSAQGATDAQRGQSLQEQLALRNQPINEISALLSGSQVSQPNFVNPSTAQIPTTDVAGLINQAFGQQQGNYNTQVGQYNNMMGGLFGLGAAGIGMF